MTEVRFATQADGREFYGDEASIIRTFTGVVVLEDDKPIILGGVYRENMAFIAFSHFKVDPDKYKREIIKATRMVVDYILPRYPLVWAVIDEKSQGKNPSSYIKHYGFKPHGGRDDIFVWRRNS